jgi:putative DNA-invertase from lambdoid prophage Rac
MNSHLGVGTISNDNSNNEPSILLALLASLAKVEAQKISERTRAGMARARAEGKRIGRPSIPHKLRKKIAERIAAGETPYAVAKALAIPRQNMADLEPEQV